MKYDIYIYGYHLPIHEEEDEADLKHQLQSMADYFIDRGKEEQKVVIREFIKDTFGGL
jgi:hypothetical protein